MDLDDIRFVNRLFEILGGDGALQLHLSSTKFPIHYMVDSETLISLSNMGNGIFKLEPNDVGQYGHSLDTESILRTDPYQGNFYS